MTTTEHLRAAERFAAEWAGKGDEKKDCQKFWLQLLGSVLGMGDAVYGEVEFEHHSRARDLKGFIDVRIPKSGVLIEQKSHDVDLDAEIEQSDGSHLTPHAQAMRYVAQLPRSEHPKWIVTCNFGLIRIYDGERPDGAPVEIRLEELPKKYAHLLCLVPGSTVKPVSQVDVSVAAGKVVDRLYQLFLAQYRHPDDPETLKALNKLCVRLVFCAYCEDSGVFNKNQFHDYLVKYPVDTLRTRLKELFKVLATPPEKRDEYLIESLRDFPYVAGGLFDDETEVPNFTEEIRDVLLKRTSQDIDWKGISPTIFGAIFESTLNPELRRKGGMHYTSVENIHKVIDPLFLDGLKSELMDAASEPNLARKETRLRDFQHHLGALTFLDPACGSGNFLTETFLSLRQLENQAIELRQKAQGGQGWLDLGDIIHVTINQFYGIEINDFAVTVAKTAMWIAESQMMIETSKIVGRNLEFLPLRNYANIVEGNALRMDWPAILQEQTRRPGARYDYIMGNPPFLGYSNQSAEQKADMLSLFVDEKGKPYKTAGKIDYVSAWYWKACRYLVGGDHRAPRPCCAFVSTNSICQGEQVAAIWKPLTQRFGIEIDYAWRTFVWDNEATEKAHVHCVIIGFHCSPDQKPLLYKSGNRSKVIYEGDKATHVSHINGYLLDGPDVFVESRSKPLCNVPEMTTGNRPTDGGHLIIEADEYDSFLSKEPGAAKYIKRFMGSVELINSKKRYCLWLVGASPTDLVKMPLVLERINKCREDRLSSPDAGRRKLADTPTLFRETQNPEKVLAIPEVSSQNRKYVPMGYFGKDVICSNKIKIIADSQLYHFGVLTSSVHMAWMRAVCGRLKSDYDYSMNIVYNNFPWPGGALGDRALPPRSVSGASEESELLKSQIEKTAQAILDARARYPEASLADLYGEAMFLYPELVAAHRANDAAVCAAYGFPPDLPESEIVSRLFALYQQLTTDHERKA